MRVAMAAVRVEVQPKIVCHRLEIIFSDWRHRPAIRRKI
jgi:hypothetical protein